MERPSLKLGPSREPFDQVAALVSSLFGKLRLAEVGVNMVIDIYATLDEV